MMTKKPCPGCGKVDRYREADKVCKSCQHLIKRAKDLQEEEAPRDSVFVRFSAVHHWNEYIYTRGAFASEIIMKAFVRLALAASVPSLNEAWEDGDLYILGKLSSGSADRYLMNKEIAEAIKDLRFIAQDLIDSVYKKGKEDGHNLLMRLASGDISPNEYLKKTMEEE